MPLGLHSEELGSEREFTQEMDKSNNFYTNSNICVTAAWFAHPTIPTIK